MVNIVNLTDTVAKIATIVNGSKHIINNDVLGYKLINAFLCKLLYFVNIACCFFENFVKNVLSYLLVCNIVKADACISFGVYHVV